MLAVARDHKPGAFPSLLLAGRLMLRQRFDPGSRRSLITTALELLPRLPAPEGEAAAPLPTAAADAARLTEASLRIELGYACGEQQRKADGTVEYARAVVLAAGVDAATVILSGAGVPVPEDGYAAAGSPPAGAVRELEGMREGHRGGVPPAAADATAIEAASATAASPAPAAERGAAGGDDLPAQMAFEEALETFIADAGVGATPPAAYHELVGEALNLLAVNLDMRGRTRGSQILFIHTMRIRQAMLGGDHPFTAAVYNNLANLLRAGLLKGRPSGGGGARKPGAKEAAADRAAGTERFVEALYRRAIAVREAALGPQSPALAASLSNLSVLIARRSTDEATDEAEGLLRRGLAIRRAVFGDDHAETAASYNLLGNLLFYQKKDYAGAERLYQLALRVRVQYYTRLSDRAGQTLHNLANLARAKGEDDQAERLFVECLNIREQVIGCMHHDTARTASQLSSLYRAQGRLTDAAAMEKRLSEWGALRRELSSGDAAWLRAEVPFRAMHVPEAFGLKSKLLGHNAVHLKHIMQLSGAERVYLGLGPQARDAERPAEERDVAEEDGWATPDMPSAGTSTAGEEPAPLPPVPPSDKDTEPAVPPTAHSPVGSAGTPTPPPSAMPASPPAGVAAGRTPLPTASAEPALLPVAAIIHVQASSEAALRKARELCEAHVNRVGGQLSRFCRNGRQEQTSGHSSAKSGQRSSGRGGGGAANGVGAGGGITLADFMLAPKKPRQRPRS